MVRKVNLNHIPFAVKFAFLWTLENSKECSFEVTEPRNLATPCKRDEKQKKL